MAQQHVIEGTWEEIQLYAREARLGSGRRVKLIVTNEPPKKLSARMMTFGMFAQLRELADEDFTAAEFHGGGVSRRRSFTATLTTAWTGHDLCRE